MHCQKQALMSLCLSVSLRWSFSSGHPPVSLVSDDKDENHLSSSQLSLLMWSSTPARGYQLTSYNIPTPPQIFVCSPPPFPPKLLPKLSHTDACIVRISKENNSVISCVG